MSPELVSTFAVGIALAGLILNAQRRIDARFARLEKRLSALEVQQAELRAEFIERMTALETELRVRMAKLEGLFEGLREALTARQVA